MLSNLHLFFSAACDIIGRSLVAVNFNKGEHHDDNIISLHCTRSVLINGGSALVVTSNKVGISNSGLKFLYFCVFLLVQIVQRTV